MGEFKYTKVLGKTYDTYLNKWKHDTPVGLDLHGPKYFLQGPCPRCGSVTSTYGGGYSCNYHLCPHSCHQFAHSAGPLPEWWETQVNVMKDGDSWCAFEDGFLNLQESEAGFGATPHEAVMELISTINSLALEVK